MTDKTDCAFERVVTTDEDGSKAEPGPLPANAFVGTKAHNSAISNAAVVAATKAA